jgi:hypothetical protein
VSFAAITLCVASQRVFIVVSVYFFMTQSGNFWIHPRMNLFWTFGRTPWTRGLECLSFVLLNSLLRSRVCLDVPFARLGVSVWGVIIIPVPEPLCMPAVLCLGVGFRQDFFFCDTLGQSC